ncbi:MAG: tRNA preQ1(34) S-adenosylmethionine ribosyltransferase-isomerase QueA [Alphaproteobacteria bacterium]|nr:tRNA preQ1(34) S-adenosylmethionine ribosyltransferase-isomerase QueA [Alphaproteobacteria bacterium]
MTHHLDDYQFALPERLIAHAPATPREAARLLRIHQGQLTDHTVGDVPSLLSDHDVLVFNNTKVIPARLFGMRGAARIEILLHQPQSIESSPGLWRCFAKPAKKLRAGDEIIFAPHFSAHVVDKDDDGQVQLQFTAPEKLFDDLQKHGHMPLPPYIKRAEAETDKHDYQTIYAQHEGAVAAPTAGLHFTHNLLEKIRDRGIETHFITLHVGAGTFLPVKVRDISQHRMHAEWGQITSETAEALTQARAAGKRVVAVGTTSLRLLESATHDGVIKPFVGTTDIFIRPGYRFGCVQALITNFHLPGSTLFMLVSALAGLDTMKRAYAHAIDRGYRFYSYGDACLIEP